MQLKYVFSKTSKNQILTVASQNYAKISLIKRLCKTFPTYFSLIFLQNFSNRNYPNVKIILAYFNINKTIKFQYHVEFWILF